MLSTEQLQEFDKIGYVVLKGAVLYGKPASGKTVLDTSEGNQLEEKLESVVAASSSGLSVRV